MKKLKIGSSLLLACVTLSYCSNPADTADADNTAAYTYQNISGSPLKDAPFSLPSSDSLGIYDETAQAWLPVQWDDLDGDGQIDEIYWLADLKAGATHSFRTGQVPDSLSSSLRSQVVFKVQDRPFSPEDSKAVTAGYQPQRDFEVPAELSPQNKWVMFEGPVWENEQIAYRFYLDSRQRNDIYGKKTASLVMDTVGWDYHDIMDWGSDILKVGNSLGIGSPAIWHNGQVHALSEAAAKRVSVVASGPLRNIIRIQFTDLKIDTFTLQLQCELEMQAGHPYTEVRLKSAAPLPEGLYFASGFVSHLAEAETDSTEGIIYLYNWGSQSFHEQQLGMAVLAKAESNPETVRGSLDHLLVLRAPRQQAAYRFLAAWEEGQSGIQSPQAFRELLQQQSRLWSVMPPKNEE